MAQCKRCAAGREVKKFYTMTLKPSTNDSRRDDAQRASTRKRHEKHEKTIEIFGQTHG
jgi:hypothetical protein